MIIDGLTKALDEKGFMKFRKLLGLVDNLKKRKRDESDDGT